VCSEYKFGYDDKSGVERITEVMGRVVEYESDAHCGKRTYFQTRGRSAFLLGQISWGMMLRDENWKAAFR
jgi:hypothetical protein